MKQFYDKSQRYNNSLYYGIFIGGVISKNLIANREIKSRRLVQVNKRYEFTIINTFVDMESIIFNPLKARKYKFIYWLHYIGNKQIIRDDIFYTRQELCDFIKKYESKKWYQFWRL